MWASQLRVVDMSGSQPNTLFKLPLEQNEAAISVCIVRWAAHAEQGVPHLVVGVAKDMILSPRSCTEGSLHVYKVFIFVDLIKLFVCFFDTNNSFS